MIVTRAIERPPCKMDWFQVGDIRAIIRLRVLYKPLEESYHVIASGRCYKPAAVTGPCFVCLDHVRVVGAIVVGAVELGGVAHRNQYDVIDGFWMGGCCRYLMRDNLKRAL